MSTSVKEMTHVTVINSYQSLTILLEYSSINYIIILIYGINTPYQYVLQITKLSLYCNLEALAQ